MKSSTLKGSALSAAALLIWSPIASAEPPANHGDQQQDQQQQGQRIANQVIDGVQQSVDQANQLPINQKTGKPYTGLHVLLNGVETCIPFGVPTTAGQRVESVPGDPIGYC